ncbi:hypothetical protein ENUP19_0146G0008 [Entamoeba nuttalli]|uniref:DENN (AEX-3) domain containing protein n=2 Tax=Entamoeba nuttalli TaxID=412467 RepID=K2GJ78_ENTNP|nr:DENN (AEX-3) domain containing protein [Entamoeba nuttalli P19]EKE42801.1 DENN (AEX-3) domain containing protein [Entamoeba nuttalli P19]|eukprot:XP_008854864.1 DENN (AEX-3) domain containing protein [Entamoeba nuttalli P19]
MSQKKIEIFDDNYKLEVQIIKAKLLKVEANDCDPYGVCKIGKVKYRTETVKKTTEPQWKSEPIIVDIEKNMKDVVVSVNRHGYVGNKIELGSARILLSRLGNDVSTTQWYDLIQNNEKVGSVQCRFKRQKTDRSNESVSNDERKWVDLLAQIHNVIEPSGTQIDKSFQYYMGTIDKRSTIMEKKSSVIGPIIGFIKIIMEHPINNIHLGQKGIIQIKVPPSLNCSSDIWTLLFPNGMTVSSTPRKPIFLPLFTSSLSKQMTYYVFLISDTEIQVDGQILYVPIAIGFVSYHPFYEIMRRMLLSIYELCPTLSNQTMDLLDGRDDLIKMTITQPSRTTQTPMLLKSSSTLNSTPPKYQPIIKGIYEMMCIEYLAYGGYSRYKYNNLNIEIRLPVKHSLPVFNTSIYPLFSIFNVSGMTTLFLLLMTNLKIVIFSSHLSLLTTSIDNLISLLYPFPPTQKVFAILPYKNLNVLSGSDTFIAGVPSEYREIAKKQLGNEEYIDVDLDTGMIEMNVSKELLEFPVDLTVDLQKDLNEAFKEKYLKMDQLGNEPYDDRYFLTATNSFNLKVRLAYFKFLTKLLEGYDEFINYVWVSDNEVFDFDVYSFFLTKSFDCEPLIKHFCESGTFLEYIKEQGFDNVFREWISNRVFDCSLTDLYNFYIKAKRITNITPANQSVIKELKDINAFTIDWEDLKRLKQSESSIRLTKQMQKDKNYCNELDKFKMDKEKPKEKHIWNAIFGRFVDDIQRNASPDMEKVYQCASNQAGRHLLLKILSSQADKMKSKGCLEYESYENLLQLMKTLVAYCKSDKDIETPLGIVEVATKYCYKKDAVTYRFLIDDIGMAEIWNNKNIWHRAFNQTMVNSMKEIYGKFYSLQLPTIWKGWNQQQQAKYREKEENSLVTTLHMIAKNMKIIGVSNKIIYEVLEDCESTVHASSEIKSVISNVVKIILENDSSLIH